MSENSGPVQFETGCVSPSRYMLCSGAWMGEQMWHAEFKPATVRPMSPEEQEIADRLLEALNLGLWEMCRAGLFSAALERKPTP